MPVVKISSAKIMVKSQETGVEFYLKKSASSKQYTTDRNYSMFKVSKDVYDKFSSVEVDKQYKSSATEDDILKFKGRLKGYAYPDYYLNFENSSQQRNASGESGTLTPVEGGESVSYLSASKGLGIYPFDFYDTVSNPLGEFSAVSSIYDEQTGYYQIDISDYSYMQYDKLRIIVHKEGNFNISDVYCTYTGGFPKRKDKNILSKLKEQGKELITDTGFGNEYNSEWELIDGATFKKIPSEINQYPGFHSEYKSYIELGFNEDKFPGVMKKTFSIEAARGYRDIIVRATARMFPKIYDPEKTPDDTYTNIRQITSSSYDLGTICLGLKMGDRTPAVIRKLVDVGWAELEFRTCIPPYIKEIEVTLWRDEKDLEYLDYKSSQWPMQVCDVSVQIVG